MPGFILGVEICEDLWMPVPPSSIAALMGATVLANLSASNEVIGKATYRKQLVAGQSGRCLAGYVYSACGVGESTTDLVFGGHCIIAENGNVVVESERFRRGGHLLVADIDLDRLVHDRVQTNSFHDANRAPDMSFGKFRNLYFEMELDSRANPNSCPAVRRGSMPHPFVPTRPRSPATTVAARSSRRRSRLWLAGFRTSARRRYPSAFRAASIPLSRCSSCARRWTISVCRAIR